MGRSAAALADQDEVGRRAQAADRELAARPGHCHPGRERTVGRLCSDGASGYGGTGVVDQPPGDDPSGVERGGDARHDAAVDDDRGRAGDTEPVGPVAPPLGGQRRRRGLPVEADVVGAGRQLAQAVRSGGIRGPAHREPPRSGEEVDPDRLRRTVHAAPDLAGTARDDVDARRRLPGHHVERDTALGRRTVSAAGAGEGWHELGVHVLDADDVGAGRERSDLVGPRGAGAARCRLTGRLGFPGVADEAPGGDARLALGTEVHLGQGAGDEAGRARREVDAGAGLTRCQHDVGGVGRLRALPPAGADDVVPGGAHPVGPGVETGDPVAAVRADTRPPR